jgi:nucleolar pre-ribosomal-associated protein 2
MQSSFINQWAIERLLGSILQTITYPAIWSDSMSVSSLYEQFCRLINTVLTIHLRKLQGRYHLVLPILQVLLTRLFIRYERAPPSKKKPAEQVTTWMSNPNTPLRTASANTFSSLLYALCEPSTQAASGAHKRSNSQLTPAKDILRKTAGQFLSTLLITYCQCQLEGRLESEIKDGLIPGLYVIFSVIDEERLHALSAAMDNSTRSLFKNLYSDYRRFGKWKGN